MTGKSYNGVHDFSLLDREYALFVTVDACYITHISTGAVRPPPTLKLCLPDLVPRGLWRYIEVLPDCKMAHSSQSHPNSPISRTQYITDGRDICALSLCILLPPSAEVHHALLVVDRRFLLKLAAPYLHRGDSIPPDPSTSTTLDWNQWGPLATRYIPLGKAEEWFIICGWRILFSVPLKRFPLVKDRFQQAGLDPGNPKYRRIALDFNPYRARLISEHTTIADSVLRWRPDDVITVRGCPEPIMTTWPCRIFVGKAGNPYFEEPDCCGDTIIDFQVSGKDSCETIYSFDLLRIRTTKRIAQGSCLYSSADAIAYG
jgi:hypothetical protein